ncbi:MAG: DUF4292 domain-containing protein [Prevotellaceae bacterium]|nr:DUF4292 domain-containing protein [Prevotellaceae bacterium]
MKPLKYLSLALLSLPLLMTSCKSKQVVVEQQQPSTSIGVEKQKELKTVLANAQTAEFVTSKVKFSVSEGTQEISLTGNLKMKRDDVIRLQLMAFGFVEAARIEFTKDYVLIMDRINKQYLKASYEHISFLRNSGLNFYSLQALFWNELFQPGENKVTESLLNNFKVEDKGNGLTLTISKNNLDYKWQTANSLINQVNVIYNDKLRGVTGLKWDYSDFKNLGNKSFPSRNNILFATPKKEITIKMTLNHLGNESEWETRTEVPGKYRQVSVDDIIRRFMSL